jgi:hypothetical protein
VRSNYDDLSIVLKLFLSLSTYVLSIYTIAAAQMLMMMMMMVIVGCKSERAREKSLI